MTKGLTEMEKKALEHLNGKAKGIDQFALDQYSVPSYMGELFLNELRLSNLPENKDDANEGRRATARLLGLM